MIRKRENFIQKQNVYRKYTKRPQEPSKKERNSREENIQTLPKKEGKISQAEICIYIYI